MNKIVITIDNESIDNIVQGCSLIERKDEELDEFQAITCVSKRLEPFSSGVRATVLINDNKTYYYVVESDKVELFSKNPNSYKHTLVLKEETIILESKINDSLSFTNPKPFIDCLNRYRNCTPVERNDCSGSTRLFSIDSAMNPDIKNRIIPETKLNYGTVKDQLVSLFAMVDAYPRVENGVLKADEFNKKRNPITNSENIIDEKMANSILEQKSSVHVFLENAIPNVETQSPSMCDVMTSRTEDAVFNTSNGALILEYPIEKIIKVETIMEFRRSGSYYSKHSDGNYYGGQKYFTLLKSTDNSYTYGSGSGVSPVGDYKKNDPPTFFFIDDDNTEKFKISVDITDRVLMSDEWNLLDVGKSSNNTKNNTLYYNVGGNTIIGVGDANSYQNLLYGYEELIMEELFRNTKFETIEINNSDGTPLYLEPNSDTGSHNGTHIKDINDVMFRVTYIPQLSCHVKLQKNNSGGEMIANQGSDRVDVEKMGYSLSGLIRRLGHAEKTLIRIFPSFDEVNHVGDYLEDNYILTAVQHIIYNDYVMSIENYNKNFNRRSIYTGIDQSTRTFATTATSIVRQINYSEYAIASIEPNKYEGNRKALISDIGKSLFTSFFTKEIDFPVEIVAVRQNVSSTAEMHQPVIKSSFGNSMLFNFKFKDKTSAGNQKLKSSGDTYYHMEPAIYTDSKGELNYLYFNLQRSKFKFDKYELKDPAKDNVEPGSYILAPDGYFYKRIDLYKYQDATVPEVPAFMRLDPINIKFDSDDVAQRSTADYLPRSSISVNKTYESVFDMFSGLIGLGIYKDVSEIPSVTYQLHVVADDPNIIIGDYFTKYNHLICKKRPELKIYSSDEKYEVYETSKCKGDVTTYFTIQNNNDGSISISKMNRIVPFPTALAIGDSDGNLIIALNITSKIVGTRIIVYNTIYFSFLNKLPDNI